MNSSFLVDKFTGISMFMFVSYVMSIWVTLTGHMLNLDCSEYYAGKLPFYLVGPAHSSSVALSRFPVKSKVPPRFDG